MSRSSKLLALASTMLLPICWAMAQTPAPASPAEGYTVHVTAPHVVNGKVMGPYHHYCKVLSPEPVIECLCYQSSDPGARLEQVEYIITKSITRNGAVTLADWNQNWHDHKQEIEEEFRKEDDLYEWVKANIPSKIPPELRENFGG